MAEYIERNKAIECIRPHVKPTTVYGEGYMQAIEHAVDILEIMPTADVQPIRRGKWVYYKNNGIWDIHKCTVCNTPFELPMDVVASSVFCYCPHCGADMRGEDNG